MNGNWALFAQGPSDRYEASIRTDPDRIEEDAAAPNHRHSHRNPRHSPRQRENDNVANESTLLLANKDQFETSRAAASASVSSATAPHTSPRSSRFRISRISRPTTPSSSSQQPLLLHSMRYWEVALPPVKQHVVGGKLVETFQASLYGNDKTRSLPAAKRRLTIEVYGKEDGIGVWGRKRRRRRSFLDTVEGVGGHSSPSSFTENHNSVGNHDSWEIFPGIAPSDIAWTRSEDETNRYDGDTNDAEQANALNGRAGTNTEYELEERDIVILRVMKPRLVNEYDDEYGFGLTSIAGGLHDRKWESQSMSDRTMSWMVGLDVDDNDDCEESGSCSHSNDDDNNSIISDITTSTKKRQKKKKNVQWIELSRTRVSQIEMVRIDLEANEVDLKMGVGPRTVVQTFHFGDEYGSLNGRISGKGNDARTFARLFELLKRLQSQRARRLANLHRGLLSLPELESKPEHSTASEPRAADENSKTKKSQTEAVSILVEIVSASNLPVPGERENEGLGGMAIPGNHFFVPAPEALPTSKPYVVVRDGRTDVHTTSVLSDTVNPIWTISTGSLCMLQYKSLLDFFERSNVLEFAVKNHESNVGVEHKTIGTVMVHKTELLEGNGDRHCYPILRPSQSVPRKNSLTSVDSLASEFKTTPYLYLRCRRASLEDIDFMTTLQKHKVKDSVDSGVYATEVFLAPSPQSVLPPSFLERPTRTDKVNGQLQCHIKPGPDPENISATSWMTPDAIETVSREHSRAWTLAGSGSIGKVFLEILGCDGLPNLARIPGHKSDPFVCVVYEDSVLNTDVIHDCLSPRWMPWSQRAFVLNMMHPCSQIFLGVLDRNRSTGLSEAKHNPLGRAVINLTNLRPCAIYTLTYQLFDSDGVDRQAKGTITIRLRIKMEDERKALLSELNWKDHFYVSTAEGSDFRSASYSLTNDSSHRSLSFRNLGNYSSEIVAYLYALDVIADALTVVILWRGHYSVTLRLFSFPFSSSDRGPEISLLLPLHSMIAFAWATVLAWDFEKSFSFLLFVIGWTLLATLEEQRRNPSFWRRPRSYCELLGILMFNKSSHKPRRTISAYEKLEEVERFESDVLERTRTKNDTLERLKRKREEHYQRWEDEVEIAPDDITSEGQQDDSSEFILAPFKSDLLPIQKNLYKLCVVLRISKSVLMWRDSYAAFWIVTMSFLGSFIAFWIPWAFLIKWGFTIFVWTLFGPWMKLVDIYYVRSNHQLNPKERIAKVETDYKLRYNLIQWSEWNSNRIRQENAIKIKDTKRYMFGKHLMRVPIWKEERFPFEPAISSSSVPYNAHPRPVKIVTRIHGQRLWGDMVPQREHNSIEEKFCDAEEDGGTNLR